MTTGKILFSLLILSVTLLILSLKLGPVFLSWHDLFSGDNANLQRIIWQIRWPTAVTAFTAGGLLGLTGALLQLLLRNPLADPYILGISGGSAAANLFGLLIGISSYWLHIFGFIGALLTTLLIFWLASQRQRFDRQRLLLTGIIMAAGWGAVISLLLVLSANTNLRNMLFWLMGDVNRYQISWLSFFILLFVGSYSTWLAPQLNLLLLGEQQAQSLGVNVKHLQWQLYFLTALLTAVAVNLVGTIGFVGLIVPHMLRLMYKSDHKFVIPGSILLGGNLLLLANLILKQNITHIQLPIGIVISIIGVPIFIFLLLR